MRASRLTCVVADDEPEIRERVADMAIANQLIVAAKASDGREAVETVVAHRPDILFLDIRMPKLNGLDALREMLTMTTPPATVLVTAFGDHALAAFELAAIDYVLKPLDPARFRVAVERASANAIAQRSRAAIERLGTVLRDGRPDLMTFRDGTRFLQLSPTQVHRFEGMDDYVEAHSDLGRHLLTCRLTHLEHVLPKPPFLRIHRSHIVNLDHVAFFETGDGRQSLMRLGGGGEVPIARARLPEVRDALRARSVS